MSQSPVCQSVFSYLRPSCEVPGRDMSHFCKIGTINTPWIFLIQVGAIMAHTFLTIPHAPNPPFFTLKHSSISITGPDWCQKTVISSREISPRAPLLWPYSYLFEAPITFSLLIPAAAWDSVCLARPHWQITTAAHDTRRKWQHQTSDYTTEFSHKTSMVLAQT